MQHDHFLIKLNFDLLILTPGSVGWGLQAKYLLTYDPKPRARVVGSAGKIFNICYHVAAFIVLFNSICNMTMF